MNRESSFTCRTRTVLLAVVCALSTVWVVPSFAGRRGDAVDAFLDAPRGAQLIVSIDRARELADDPGGQAALVLLKHVSPELPAAWAGLARQLGMSERGAFDKLFGERAMIASRRNADGTWAWVIRCLVDDATAKVLRRSIAEAPRKLVGGRQVLAAEGGTFELIVIDLRGSKRAEVLLGPAAQPALLDAAAVHRPQGGALLQRGNPKEHTLELLPRGARIFVYTELNDTLLHVLADVDGGCDGWSALAAKPDENGIIHFSFVTVDENRQDLAGDVKLWSRSTFDAFAHGAVAAVMESDALSREIWPTIREKFLQSVDHPLPLPADEDVAGRIAVGLYPSPTGPMDMVIGVETPHVSALAPSGDRFMAQLVGLLPEMGDGTAHDFGGVAPETLREADLRNSLGHLALMGWPDVGPVLAWRYPLASDAVDRGWMTVGIGSELVEAASEALVAPAEGPHQAWLSLGLIRPHAMVRALGEMPWLTMPRWFDELRRVESISWQVKAGPGGALVGTGEVQFNPAAGGGGGAAPPIHECDPALAGFGIR